MNQFQRNHLIEQLICFTWLLLGNEMTTDDKQLFIQTMNLLKWAKEIKPQLIHPKDYTEFIQDSIQGVGIILGREPFADQGGQS